MMKLFRTLLVMSLYCLASSTHAQAMSVSWQGSTAVMTSSQSFLTDWLVAYSFRNDLAIAARAMRMTMGDGSEMKFFAPQIDYLLKRWNGQNFQANVYLNGAFGAQVIPGKTSHVGIGTLESDIESRAYYVSAKVQENLVGIGANQFQSEFRLGLAPYQADYEELASWLMVSVQNNPALIRNLSITPLVRIFYKSTLVELGSNLQGDWMFNSMIHF
jgi:hypothetical protein